jgi:hypothetical protein
MSEHQPHHPAGPPKHEAEGTNVRLTTIWVTGFFIFTFVAFGVSLLFHVGFLKWTPFTKRSQPASPLAQVHRVPPEPRLQSNPTIDMARWREIEQNAVSTYGWIDSQAGRLRLPVDRAMELVASEGLPARKGASDQ